MAKHKLISLELILFHIGYNKDAVYLTYPFSFAFLGLSAWDDLICKKQSGYLTVFCIKKIYINRFQTFGQGSNILNFYSVRVHGWL